MKTNRPPKGVMVMSNYEPGDVMFDSDVGSWNVTRALADCLAGKHKTYQFDVAEVINNTSAVEVDEAKVASMVADKARLAVSPPPIFIGQGGMIWLMDGHHRVRALHRLGLPNFLAYVIEETDAFRYQVLFQR